MTDYLEINAEISFPVRLQLLIELSNGSSKLNELAEKFPLSKSEISRHLSRLIEVEFITKNVTTNHYQLTTLAENYLCIFSPLEFLIKQKNFFKSHKIDLPAYLARQIDSLSNATIMEGSGNSLSKVQLFLTKLKILLNWY